MLEVERTRDSRSAQSGTAAARAPFRDAPAEVSKIPADIRVNSHHSPVSRTTSAPTLLPKVELRSSQTRIPVITGEVNYKGWLPVDGVLTGQLGGSGGSLAVRQKSGAAFSKGPELSGEITFREMVRVNGHVAGTIYSERGTLIVDDTALVDANVEVAVAVINGTIKGDIVAHQKVEIGPGARIYGNIWTRSIAIKDGAVFEGVCNMIED